MAATFQLSLPDSLVKAIGVDVSDLPRYSLEAIVAESYRNGRMTHQEVSEALAISRWETDAVLKKHGAHRPREAEEFSEDFQNLRRLAK